MVRGSIERYLYEVHHMLATPIDERPGEKSEQFTALVATGLLAVVGAASVWLNDRVKSGNSGVRMLLWVISGHGNQRI